MRAGSVTSTWLLKECIAELMPIITDIVNMSLHDSQIPKSPLLKKTGLDSDIECYHYVNIFLTLQRRPISHYIIRNIIIIRKYIPQDTSIVLIKSLVMSILDYSNGLFYGLHKHTLVGS